MIKINCNKHDLENCTGVYIFRNTKNGKCYIGSTVMTFKKRMDHHLWHLRENKHKNSHFQNAWNKYGEDVFEYDILEICDKSECLNREQYYLNTILFAQDFINGKSNEFIKLGYNINPLATGTPNLSKETIEKRTKTFSVFIKEASAYYSKFKNFEIDLDDIPEKYMEMIQSWINNVPWNKGKHYESTDHLKVPKTITEKTIKARKENSIKARNKGKRILVFDIDHNYLGKWRSPADLHEWSLSDNNNYPLILSGKAKSKELLAQNLTKACRTKKPYKGLYFEYEDDARLRCKSENEEGKIEEPWDGDIELTYSITQGE
jgi:group I intron endonuclease